MKSSQSDHILTAVHIALICGFPYQHKISIHGKNGSIRCKWEKSEIQCTKRRHAVREIKGEQNTKERTRVSE